MTTGRMTTGVTVLAVAMLVMMGTGTVSAQGMPLGLGLELKPWTDRGFVNVNGGVQTSDRRTITSGAQPIFDQFALWNSPVEVRSSAIFDISGGYRVWRNVAAAIGYSRYRDKATAGLGALIPDPLVFDDLHTESIAVSGLSHTENAVHLSAVVVAPLTDKIHLSVFAGPSFTSVAKDVVGDVVLATTTPNLQGAVTRRIKNTAAGGHIGFDVRYRVYDQIGPIQHVGAAFFLRYSGGSVDDASVAGGSINVGGLNYGAGIRLGF